MYARCVNRYTWDRIKRLPAQGFIRISQRWINGIVLFTTGAFMLCALYTCTRIIIWYNHCVRVSTTALRSRFNEIVRRDYRRALLPGRIKPHPPPSQVDNGKQKSEGSGLRNKGLYPVHGLYREYICTINYFINVWVIKNLGFRWRSDLLEFRCSFFLFYGM
jgi:hypothetical protein